MPHTFYTPKDWIGNCLRILLLGAGGTGGEVLYALARIHTLLLAVGNRYGLHVTLMDGDRVSASNIGRQRFAACDIRYFKSDVLIHRLNLFFGFNWQSIPAYWSPRSKAVSSFHKFNLIITCVDRAKVRVALARAGARHPGSLLWMDFGNDQHTGQCVLGHLGAPDEPLPLRLPHVYDLDPRLASVNDDDAPSCSAAEAIRQQDLFVNPLLAESGLGILWNLLRHGRTNTQGVLVDAREPSVVPLYIDPVVWASYGYTPKSAVQAPASPSKAPTRRRVRAQPTADVEE